MQPKHFEPSEGAVLTGGGDFTGRFFTCTALPLQAIQKSQVDTEAGHQIHPQ